MPKKFKFHKIFPILIIPIIVLASVIIYASFFVEANNVKGTVMDFYNARNNHSVDDELALVTEDVKHVFRDESIGASGVNQGREFYRSFVENRASDTTFKYINIIELQVSGNTAFVQCIGIEQSVIDDKLFCFFEDFELIKIGNSWKISKDYFVGCRHPGW